jgi:hypothetical protein
VSKLTPETITQTSLQRQIEYKRLHLQNIAKWVLEDYAEIQKSLSAKTKNNSDLSFSVSQLINKVNTPSKQAHSKELIDAVNAFKDIEGESWYPRLRFLSETAITSRSADDNPLTIVEDASVDGQLFTGYELDENLELYALEETPTQENTAARNIVIIELDDTDCDANQKCNSGGGGNNGGGGNTGGGNDNNHTSI